MKSLIRDVEVVVQLSQRLISIPTLFQAVAYSSKKLKKSKIDIF